MHKICWSMSQAVERICISWLLLTKFMKIFFKELLEYIQSLWDAPCIITSDLNDLITLCRSKVIFQWVDVVGDGL